MSHKGLNDLKSKGSYCHPTLILDMCPNVWEYNLFSLAVPVVLGELCSLSVAVLLLAIGGVPFTLGRPNIQEVLYLLIGRPNSYKGIPKFRGSKLRNG